MHPYEKKVFSFFFMVIICINLLGVFDVENTSGSAIVVPISFQLNLPFA